MRDRQSFLEMQDQMLEDTKKIARGILDGTFGVTNISWTYNANGQKEHSITGFELPAMFNKKPEPKLTNEYHCPVLFDFSKSMVSVKDYALIRGGLRCGELIHTNHGTGLNGDNDIDETIVVQDTIICADGLGYRISEKALAQFVARYGGYRIVRVDQVGKKL